MYLLYLSGPKVEESLEDELVRDVLQSGVDLRSYSGQVEKELRSIESDLVRDYLKESPKIANLHEEITGCDKILERLEGILCTFQADLGNICQEILNLQEESVSLSIRLKHKQIIRGELSQFVAEIIVPEAVISHIIDTPPSEADFLEQLKVLDQKITFVNEQSYRDAVCCKDIQEILQNLKMKAVSKIRDYCLKKIQSFRKPMTNYQIGQNALLKNKFFYEFLVKHDMQVAKEIVAEYLDTMSKVYYSYFKEYHQRLSKLRFGELADKDDLMGVEENIRNKISLFSGKSSLKSKSSIFSISNRDNMLTTDLESPIIVPHVAQKMETRFPMEAIFRSHQFALLDNACREYLFLAEYFRLTPNQSLEHFNVVFGKTLNFYTKVVEEEYQPSYDPIGIFLSLHIVYRFKLLAHKMAVAALDPYLDSLVKIIRPRFDFLFDVHIQSVKNIELARLSSCDTRPHYITRRYAEFSAGIMSVNDTYPDDRISVSLAILQNEVENLILRMAARFDSPKEQLIFIINNVDMILGVLMERMKEDSKESENLKQQLNKRIHDFVEELLYPYFGPMMSFVKDCEVYLEREDVKSLEKEEKKVTNLVKNFNGNWRKAIEDVNREVMTSFTNFKCGNNIQQAALTQLIQYYHRFHKIVSMNPFKSNPIRSELINIHQLMVEIKKYKSSF